MKWFHLAKLKIKFQFQLRNCIPKIWIKLKFHQRKISKDHSTGLQLPSNRILYKTQEVRMVQQSQLMFNHRFRPVSLRNFKPCKEKSIDRSLLSLVQGSTRQRRQAARNFKSRFRQQPPILQIKEKNWGTKRRSLQSLMQNPLLSLLQPTK